MLDAISFLPYPVNDACHSLNILSTDLNLIHLSVELGNLKKLAFIVERVIEGFYS